jgi:hypothetical protein
MTLCATIPKLPDAQAEENQDEKRAAVDDQTRQLRPIHASIAQDRNQEYHGNNDKE